LKLVAKVGIFFLLYCHSLSYFSSKIMAMKNLQLVIAFLLFAFTALSQALTEQQATNLARMPLHCISTEYPNKTSHLINAQGDAILTPSQLHPSFYGCLDWHSSVHGHWMLVKLLKQFPNLALKDSIVQLLNTSFLPVKINEEAAYFINFKSSNVFERTYGWAWLLKLDQELYTFDDPVAKQWYQALQPLTKQVITLWKNYLPKQTYPNRTGVHPNTAFRLVFALDWARTLKDTAFESAIIKSARTFYLNNVATPAYLEPDGTDFLSPSLEIADLMSRVLAKQEFIKWFTLFYEKRSLDTIVKLPIVSDRTDMQIVHLDGLSLSRAWCMTGIAKLLPATNKTKILFEQTATQFLQNTLPVVTSGNYGGDHWLASFAVYALSLR
jgi:hypothetical protein